MKPKVSVIIPVYNGEKTLRQCLDSVLNQSYPDYEIILVDNNSTDHTKKMINEFQTKDKRVRYLFQEKIARGAARNTGERKAKGKIILTTDSDCVVPRNWIWEMTKPIIQNNQIAVQGIKKAYVVNYWTEHIQMEEEILKIQRVKDKKIGLLDTANFAIRKTALIKIGYTNPNLVYGEDTELMIRLKSHGYTIYFKKVAVLHHHPDTALKVFKKFLNRAIWHQRIEKMCLHKKTSFPQQNVLNHLRFFCGILLELLTLHRNFKYDLVSGSAWRIGLMIGWFKR